MGGADNLQKRDLDHIWHPCSQMQDYEDFPPLEVAGAEGCHLILADGRRLVDSTSSWWCKTLGHGHPRLRAALARQAGRFEHAIFANTTYRDVVELSEALATLCPGLDKVFYACEGSTAVEIAAKLALHAQALRGHPERTRFLALENGYHGESALALALGDLGIYKDPYRAVLPEVGMLTGLPYRNGRADADWDDCAAEWPALEAQLEARAEGLAAIFVEPVLQGAGGMRLYSPDLLRRLRRWTARRGVYLVADEILTGFGRTGRALACDHAGIAPDFICLSKGLTAGWLPMSAVLLSSETYGLFYDDYARGKSFLHSNTFAGNALAAAVALEAWKVYADEGLYARARDLEPRLLRAMGEVAAATGKLGPVRGLGAVAAADLRAEPGKRTGYRIFREAVRLGALLRPLGDTLYWVLPLNASEGAIEELRDVTIRAVRAVLG